MIWCSIFFVCFISFKYAKNSVFPKYSPSINFNKSLSVTPVSIFLAKNKVSLESLGLWIKLSERSPLMPYVDLLSINRISFYFVSVMNSVSYSFEMHFNSERSEKLLKTWNNGREYSSHRTSSIILSSFS